MNIFHIVISILAAYLLGSVPSAVWFGKMLHGIDVREHGSGNAGATNVIRVLGYKAGIPVLLFDVFKGWLAVELSFLFPVSGLEPSMMTWLRIAMALAAVIGHVFPVFAGFRGGKGVGTMAGVGIALFPLALLVVLGIFILVLATTRYVSLSSVTGALAFPLAVWFISGERHPALLGLAILVALFIPATHWKNIHRLIHGTEKKFDFKRKNSENSSVQEQ
jgi:glycerol-3-phosphate acyltransferase PlsY